MLRTRKTKSHSFNPQLRTIWCCTFLFVFMAHLPSFLKLSITSFHKNWLLLKILNLGQLMTNLHFLCIASMIVDLTKITISTFLKKILALYLKVEDLFFIQFAKGDASWHQHRCCFWHSEHFPSQIFKKGCQFGLEIQFSWNEIESGILSFLIENWKNFIVAELEQKIGFHFSFVWFLVHKLS